MLDLKVHLVKEYTPQMVVADKIYVLLEAISSGQVLHIKSFQAHTHTRQLYNYTFEDSEVIDEWCFVIYI